MKSKKLLLLTLAFGLFSMINCLALKVTVNNPYHNQGVQIELRNIDAMPIGVFPNRHHSEKITYSGDIVSGILTYMELKIRKSDDRGFRLSLLQSDYDHHYTSSKSLITSKTDTVEGTLNNNFYQVTYQIRVRGKNSKIQSLKVDILRVTVNGFDQPLEGGLFNKLLS